MSDIKFPNRNEIKKNYIDGLIDQAKSIDVDKIDFTGSNFAPMSKILEKQKVFFWVRIYLNEEDTKLKPNDDVFIVYDQTGEQLETKFICYSKKGLEKDSQDQMINYVGEEDKKILCLMVDSERINNNSEDIKFIRTLFKIGKYYEIQLMKRNELTIKSKDHKFAYYDIEF